MEIVSKSYLSTSLILQTLQQLRDVYGQDVDKVIQGNTSNIVKGLIMYSMRSYGMSCL